LDEVNPLICLEGHDRLANPPFVCSSAAVTASVTLEAVYGACTKNSGPCTFEYELATTVERTSANGGTKQILDENVDRVTVYDGSDPTSAFDIKEAESHDLYKRIKRETFGQDIFFVENCEELKAGKMLSKPMRFPNCADISRVGSHAVRYTVEDINGNDNDGTMERTVIVQDTIPPTITLCPCDASVRGVTCQTGDAAGCEPVIASADAFGLDDDQKWAVYDSNVGGNKLARRIDIAVKIFDGNLPTSYPGCPLQQHVHLESGNTEDPESFDPKGNTLIVLDATNDMLVKGNAAVRDFNFPGYNTADLDPGVSTCDAVDRVRYAVNPADMKHTKTVGDFQASTADWSLVDERLTRNEPTIQRRDNRGPYTPADGVVVTYTATDDAGNSNSIERVVVINDQTPPTITQNGPSGLTVLQPHTIEAQKKRVPYDDRDAASGGGGGAVVFDVVEKDITNGQKAFDEGTKGLVVSQEGAVDNTKLGQYEVHFDASDSAGNKATTVVRHILVEDTTRPEMQLALPTDDHATEEGVVHGGPCDSDVCAALDSDLDATLLAAQQPQHTAYVGADVAMYWNFGVPWNEAAVDAQVDAAKEWKGWQVTDTFLPTAELEGYVSVEGGWGGDVCCTDCTSKCQGKAAVDHTADVGTIFELSYNVHDKVGVQASGELDRPDNELVAPKVRKVLIVDTLPPQLTLRPDIGLEDVGEISVNYGGMGQYDCATLKLRAERCAVASVECQAAERELDLANAELGHLKTCKDRTTGEWFEQTLLEKKLMATPFFDPGFEFVDHHFGSGFCDDAGCEQVTSTGTAGAKFPLHNITNATLQEVKRTCAAMPFGRCPLVVDTDEGEINTRATAFVSGKMAAGHPEYTDPGEYTVEYAFIDLHGNLASQPRTFVVRGKPASATGGAGGAAAAAVVVVVVVMLLLGLVVLGGLKRTQLKACFRSNGTQATRPVHGITGHETRRSTLATRTNPIFTNVSQNPTQVELGAEDQNWNRVDAIAAPNQLYADPSPMQPGIYDEAKVKTHVYEDVDLVARSGTSHDYESVDQGRCGYSRGEHQRCKADTAPASQFCVRHTCFASDCTSKKASSQNVCSKCAVLGKTAVLYETTDAVASMSPLSPASAVGNPTSPATGINLTYESLDSGHQVYDDSPAKVADSELYAGFSVDFEANEDEYI
jgi:hypothetical protein